MRVAAASAALLLLVACGSERERTTTPRRDAGPATDAGPSADAGPRADAGPVADAGTPDAAVDPTEEPADLGDGCPGGCNLPICVLENEDCEGGVCVWHGPLGGAYCSRPCITTCRPGYSCQVADDGEGPVCISDTPVCGNGNVEYGEACDDGNTEPDDFCAANCGMVTEPPSGGTMTQSFHGNPPTTATGNDPVVSAQKSGTIIFLASNLSAMTYGLRLADDAGPAPFTTLIEAGLQEAVDGNLCTYVGSTLANITRLDRAAQEVAGDLALQMVCMGGNCEFGCNPEFSHTMSFDVRWVDL